MKRLAILVSSFLILSGCGDDDKASNQASTLQPSNLKASELNITDTGSIYDVTEGRAIGSWGYDKKKRALHVTIRRESLNGLKLRDGYDETITSSDNVSFMLQYLDEELQSTNIGGLFSESVIVTIPAGAQDFIGSLHTNFLYEIDLYNSSRVQSRNPLGELK